MTVSDLLPRLKSIRKRTWLSGCAIAADAVARTASTFSASATATPDPTGTSIAIAGGAALLGTAANIAVNLLSSDIESATAAPPRPDAATLERWRNHDLTQACGHAIADIIYYYAHEQQRESTRDELLALARALPQIYASASELPFLPGAEDAASLEIGSDWQHTPTAETADWVGFLHYAAQEARVVFTSENQDFLPALGNRLRLRFRQQFQEYCAWDANTSDSPTGGRAYAKKVLTQLSGILQKLDRVEQKVDAVHQHVSEVKGMVSQLLERDAIARYRKHLRDCFDIHEVIGLTRPGSEADPGNPTVRSIYVPPACAPSHITPETMQRIMQGGGMENPTSPLLPLLGKHQRIVLLGDPGMGKSTLVRWLISTLAAEDKPAEMNELWGVTPLPFILRDVMREMKHTPPEQWTWDTLWNAFLQYRPDDKLSEPLAQPLNDNRDDRRALMDSGQVLFLLDGLDEVGSSEHRRHLRRIIWDGFKRYPKARWLITSRVIGYMDGPVDKEMWSEMQAEKVFMGDEVHDAVYPKWHTIDHASCFYLSPFDDSRQEAFSQRWFYSRLGDTAGPARAKLLMEKLRSHRSGSTQVIGRVPNLLLLMALLFQNRVHLPDGRAQLYGEISQAYLEAIDRDYGLEVPYDRADSEKCLARIAMHMQLGRQQERTKATSNQASEESRDITATEDELRTWLRGCIVPVDDSGHDQAIEDFLSHIARRSGLFLPRGPGVYGFTHLSFQEYYTACHLKRDFHRLLAEDELDGETAEVETLSNLPLVTRKSFAEAADSSVWHEPLIFLVETLEGDAPFTRTILKWMFPKNDQKTGISSDYSATAARLLASLTVDRQVTLSLVQRRIYWEALWKAQLEGDAKDDMAAKRHVASELLEATDFQEEVISVLIQCGRNAKHLSLATCTGLASIDFLSQMTNLKRLYLEGCTGLTNLEVLSTLQGLQSLDLAGCSQINSINPLCELTELWFLSLRGCTGLASVETLPQLPGLHCLILDDCTQLTSVEPLGRITWLTWLSLRGCTGLTSIGALRHLSRLEMLLLNRCSGIKAGEAMKLRQKLPNCHIIE